MAAPCCPWCLHNLADLTALLPSADDKQVTELAADQQSSVGGEEGFEWSDTF